MKSFKEKVESISSELFQICEEQSKLENLVRYGIKKDDALRQINTAIMKEVYDTISEYNDKPDKERFKRYLSRLPLYFYESSGYSDLVNVQLPLNHDRYKTYFTQFLVVIVGLFTGLITSNKLQLEIKPIFHFLGMSLSIIWLLVLCKVTVDIKKCWFSVRLYEVVSSQIVQLTSLGSSEHSKNLFGKIPATTIMNTVPILTFLAFYIMAASDYQWWPIY